tara:strand:- start:431 stop:715 length:285 start_codon:yes stop_codon:yes gene_type:complete
MIELAISFGLFALFSLGIDWMMWRHFSSIYEAQFVITDKLLKKLDPAGVSGHTGPIGATGVPSQLGLSGATDDTLSATEFYDKYIETGEEDDSL